MEEYDFTVCHRPGKAQTHVDGLSRLPVGPAPPEDTLLHVQVDTEEEAQRLAQELHTATHLGGQALWKLFSDRYAYKAGRRLCIEVAQSCPQCQLGATMATVPRLQEPYSHEVPGIRSQLTLWALFPPITHMSFSSCLLIAIRGTPFLSLRAITQQAQ